MEGEVLMVRVRLWLALAVLGAALVPYDQATYAVDDSSHRHGIGAPPIDPIIEELHAIINAILQDQRK